MLGSSHQAHQYLLFFKDNIKGQKSKFWLVGRQKPTRPDFIYKRLYGTTQYIQLVLYLFQKDVQQQLLKNNVISKTKTEMSINGCIVQCNGYGACMVFMVFVLCFCRANCLLCNTLIFYDEITNICKSRHNYSWMSREEKLYHNNILYSFNCQSKEFQHTCYDLKKNIMIVFVVIV